MSVTDLVIFKELFDTKLSIYYYFFSKKIINRKKNQSLQNLVYLTNLSIKKNKSYYFFIQLYIVFFWKVIHNFFLSISLGETLFYLLYIFYFAYKISKDSNKIEIFFL